MEILTDEDMDIEAEVEVPYEGQKYGEGVIQGVEVGLVIEAKIAAVARIKDQFGVMVGTIHPAGVDREVVNGGEVQVQKGKT